MVDPKYAKTREYRKVIETIQKQGKCPFCPDNFKYHKHPIIKKSGDWFLTKISWPYKNHKFHFIIIGEKHRENISELTPTDMKDILFLIKWAAARFKIKGGAMAMRFGETSYTGATVCHLHAHLIVPQKGKTVNFPIG